MNRLLEPLLRHGLGQRMPLPPACRATALPAGVVLRCGGWIPALGGLLARTAGPAAAVTLRNTVVVHPRARLTPRLLAHELEHVRQWRADRWFPLRYTWETLRRGYHDNRYEVQARAAAERAAAPDPPSTPELP